MFEEFTNQAMGVLSLTIGGVSIGAVITLAIYLINAVIKNRREIAVTKNQIEDAFKSAVLPKNIKLDVSNKIQMPIKEGLAQIQVHLSEHLGRVERGERLILKILSLFSHVDKLPKEIRDEIEDFVDDGVTIEEEI